MKERLGPWLEAIRSKSIELKEALVDFDFKKLDPQSLKDIDYRAQVQNALRAIKDFDYRSINMKHVNFGLIALVFVQFSLVVWLSNRKTERIAKSDVPKAIPMTTTVSNHRAPVRIQSAQLPLVHGPQLRQQPQSKPMGRETYARSAPLRSGAQVGQKTNTPSSRFQRTGRASTPHRNVAVARATGKAANSRYDGLMRDAFRSVDRDLEASRRASLTSELRLSKKQASILIKRHQRLRADLVRAEQKRASGMKKMLVNDHLAWAKEFLGRERYEIYRERSPELSTFQSL